MTFAPKKPMAFNISENNFGYFYFKSTKFYLSMSTDWDVTKDQVRVLQNFEDFCIEAFIQIHSFHDAKNLQNSIAPSLWSFVTFQPVDVDK